MKFGPFVLHCLVIGIIAFAVGILVSLFFNLIIHGSALVAWGTMFRIAVILGLVIPISELLNTKKKE
jgi:hypothetical protein